MQTSNSAFWQIPLVLVGICLQFANGEQKITYTLAIETAERPR